MCQAETNISVLNFLDRTESRCMKPSVLVANRKPHRIPKLARFSVLLRIRPVVCLPSLPAPRLLETAAGCWLVTASQRLQTTQQVQP
ncbi:hypothetical protein M3J09_011841 [Ascochyta lentis]